MNALRRWIARNVVADDPHPEHGTLACCADTYPTRSEVRTAVIRGTTVGDHGASLLTAPQVDRVTDSVLAALCPDNDTRTAVEAAEDQAWSAAGEVGAFPEVTR